MKKTFLAKRNALLSSVAASWGAVALLGAVAALLVRLLAPNFFLHTLAPVFRIADAVTAGSRTVTDSFGSAAALAARNEQLARENAALANENAALLAKEASLGGLSLDAQGIIAGVVARPPASPYDTLVLSQGSRGEVVKGMEAFGEGGVPLGIISSVLADFSRVTLFSSPDMVVDGWVGSSHLPLTIFGAGAGAMRAVIARSAGVAVGDTVFAPGPGLLPIGSVVRVDSDPSSPSVTLQIRPAVNPFAVSWVELRYTGPAFAASLSWATSTLP